MHTARIEMILPRTTKIFPPWNVWAPSSNKFVCLFILNECSILNFENSLFQGSGAKSGAPRSSTAADRLAQLERSFNVRQTTIPVFSNRIESNSRGIQRPHEILQDRRNSEVWKYARVHELNESWNSTWTSAQIQLGRVVRLGLTRQYAKQNRCPIPV